MQSTIYTRQQLTAHATLTKNDWEQIRQCRSPHNHLGFAYQIAFARLNNYLPNQNSFEIHSELLEFISHQMDIPQDHIQIYQRRQQTISSHQFKICNYLKLRHFRSQETQLLEQYLFNAACQLESPGVLLSKAALFLRDKNIQRPAESKLLRIISNQREKAKNYIFDRLSGSLSSKTKENLDQLLTAGETRFSILHHLKQPPGNPSPSSMLKLTDKLQKIKDTTILEVDLSWLNNNYQKTLVRYVKRCSRNH